MYALLPLLIFCPWFEALFLHIKSK